VRLSKTETRWKTLHPIYNEKFQWDITLTECLQENAVVVFTVKDYDFLSKNDFLGEAIVPLALVSLYKNDTK
jgi:BAI1-associated protein 3